MTCVLCGNEIEKPHLKSRLRCKDCQKKIQVFHVKESRRKKAEELKLLRKENKKLKKLVYQHRYKTRQMRQVVRAVERCLIDKE